MGEQHVRLFVNINSIRYKEARLWSTTCMMVVSVGANRMSSKFQKLLVMDMSVLGRIKIYFQVVNI